VRLWSRLEAWEWRAELAAHYAETVHRSDDDYVFAHPERGTRLEHEWYAGEFRKALATAGITDHLRPFHDARHGALTNLAAGGASPVAIMGIAGHRSMQTTEQYVHLAGVVFRDEAAALERRLLGLQDSSTNSPEAASLSGNA
jgi:integrase